MKMKINKRTTKKTSDLKVLRLNGEIPAIIYETKEKSLEVSLSKADFDELTRSIPKGTLSTTVIEADFEGKTFPAIVKGIQYNRVTYEVEHIDLMRLDDRESILVNVPVQATGHEACPGMRLGGKLKLIQRHVRVRCKVKAMPKVFTADISHLGMKQSVRIRDLSIPKDVVPCLDEKEVILTVSK